MRHGGEIYDKTIQYDFSISVNPLGLPEQARCAAIEAIDLAGQYPDVKAGELKQAICEKHGYDFFGFEGNIVIGNGAAEIIYGLCQTIKPKEALVVSPTFSEYEKAVRSNDGVIKKIPLIKDKNVFRLPDDFIENITKSMDIVFLCNPNNPTGNVIEKAYMRRILEQCEKQDCYLCVDECFLPFLETEEAYSMLHEKQSKKLIVLRAFTKIYAMAGLRLGYGIVFDKELSSKMQENIQPWNTSIVAQNAGTKALADDLYLEKTKKWLSQEKGYLEGQLIALKKDIFKEKTAGNKTEETGRTKLSIYQTHGNFIYFESEPWLFHKLLERGILIRDCSNFEDLEEGCYRIGIRSRKENEILMKHMRELLLDGNEL